jgi:hypothetical protein
VRARLFAVMNSFFGAETFHVFNAFQHFIYFMTDFLLTLSQNVKCAICRWVVFYKDYSLWLGALAELT